jgi:hypothetical protein
VSVLFEDSAEATQALTNAPSPRHFKASSPLKEGEEEGSDKWYWRSFGEKGEVMAFEEVEPLGRQAEKDHPVIRCGRYCVEGTPPKEELGCKAARREETIGGCEATMGIVR